MLLALAIASSSIKTYKCWSEILASEKLFRFLISPLILLRISLEVLQIMFHAGNSFYVGLKLANIHDSVTSQFH